MIYWNVLLVESIEYCPFQKETSNENEMREVLFKETVCVYIKELEPRVNVLRLGRSNQSI